MAEHETERRGVHPISGEPENRRNPGHEINQAGSNPVNLRQEGGHNRNDQPDSAAPPSAATEGEAAEQRPENEEMFGDEPGRVPDNRTQAEQRKDQWG